MNREEITNNAGYAQEKANLEYIRQRQEHGVNDPYMITEIDEAFDAGYDKGYQYAQTHPNWISVEDELPKCNIVDCGLATYPVLVYREDGFIDISCYDSEVGEWDCVGVVTHWMPLPQPPRKEG